MRNPPSVHISGLPPAAVTQITPGASGFTPCEWGGSRQWQECQDNERIYCCYWEEHITTHLRSGKQLTSENRQMDNTILSHIFDKHQQNCFDFSINHFSGFSNLVSHSLHQYNCTVFVSLNNECEAWVWMMNAWLCSLPSVTNWLVSLAIYLSSYWFPVPLIGGRPGEPRDYVAPKVQARCRDMHKCFIHGDTIHKYFNRVSYDVNHDVGTFLTWTDLIPIGKGQHQSTRLSACIVLMTKQIIITVAVTKWNHMVTNVCVNSGSGNGLLSDSTRSLPKPKLTYHQKCSVAFIWEQFS